MNCLIHQENGFDRISLEDVYIFGFHASPTLDLAPIPIADPHHPLLFPGARLMGIGGKNTSAGYKTISLIDSWMEYRGSVMLGDFELLCFEYYKSGMPTRPNFRGEYAAAYYGWLRMSIGQWFISNTACAGRVIETTKVILI